MRKPLLLLSLLLLLPTLRADDVAVVDGTTSITRQEIDAAIAPRLRKLAADEEQIRRDVLQELIDEKLLATEAARRGVSVEALLAAEVTAKAGPDSGDEKARRAAIRAAREAFLATLAKKAGVRIALQPVRTAIATAGRPSLGSAAAPVTIVVFSDFECPFCGEAAALLKEVQRLEGDAVRVVHRHYPLPIHKRAERAAEAAECAARAGKFWPMHDALFANAKKLSDADLAAYAAAAGIDPETFGQCLASGVARAAVEADRRAAQEAGIDGTPAIFVNGRRVAGPRTVDALRRLISEEKAR